MKYLLLLLGLCGILVATADATPSPAVKGITVSPAIEQINLSQNQTSASFATQITNNTNVPVVLRIGAEDFTSLNQYGGISFLGAGSAHTAHGLTSFLHIADPQLALGPGQSQTVPITIVNVNQLATGGHYTALTYRLQSATSGKGNNVSIQQTVSSLVFLSTYGQGTQTSELTTPVIGSFFTSFPHSINTVFTNSGNTQTTPRGIVQILNAQKKVISQATINVNSGLILPQSKRLFSLNLITAVGQKHLWPGMYTLRIVYSHDGQTVATVYQQRFLFINEQLIIAIVILVLGIVIFVIRKYFPETFSYRLRKEI